MGGFLLTPAWRLSKVNLPLTTCRGHGQHSLRVDWQGVLKKISKSNRNWAFESNSPLSRCCFIMLHSKRCHSSILNPHGGGGVQFYCEGADLAGCPVSPWATVRVDVKGENNIEVHLCASVCGVWRGSANGISGNKRWCRYSEAPVNGPRYRAELTGLGQPLWARLSLGPRGFMPPNTQMDCEGPGGGGEGKCREGCWKKNWKKTVRWRWGTVRCESEAGRFIRRLMGKERRGQRKRINMLLIQTLPPLLDPNHSQIRPMLSYSSIQNCISQWIGMIDY